MSNGLPAALPRIGIYYRFVGCRKKHPVNSLQTVAYDILTLALWHGKLSAIILQVRSYELGRYIEYSYHHY
jgi:hypothetical protein